jgi:hypothetical protein
VGAYSYIHVHIPYKQSLSKEISGAENKYMLIYLCSALVISFESVCFYGMWTWIYEYALPLPIIAYSYDPVYKAGSLITCLN